MLLAGLVLVYVLTMAFHLAGRESNVVARAFTTDTSGATEMDLYPYRGGRQEVRLVRQGGKWRVQSGPVDAAPVAGSAESLLGALVKVPTQRLVSRSKSKWDEFRVGDTTGTRVVIYKGKDPVADYFIGGSSGAGAGLYGGGAAYMRENGHEEVYAIDGYLDGMVDRTFGDWRDRSFLRLSTSGVTGISFQGTPGFMLTKKDSTWRLGGGVVSTDSVNRYLSRLQGYNLDRFADDFHSTGSPDRSILFSGASSPMATVRAWRRADGSWVVNSSQNADGYFVMSDSAMDRDLWRAPAAFEK